MDVNMDDRVNLKEFFQFLLGNFNEEQHSKVDPIGNTMDDIL